MGSPVVLARGLGRRFGSTVAVERLDLEVGKGEVFGLLGPNGGGKTTTVRMLGTLIAPSEGTGEVLGIPLGEPGRGEEIRERIGFLPEYHGLYDRLSAWRNLDFHAQLYGMSPADRKARITSLLKKLEVFDRKDDAVATFSRGMRQKIAIARAVVHDPELVFLDEPTANLDPEATATVRSLILDLRKEGRTIFVNTHNLDEAQRVCDRVGVLKRHLLALGTPADLARQRQGMTTRIELATPSDAVVRALRAGFPQSELRVEGRSVIVSVTQPDEENPRLARAVVEAGGSIVSVQEEAHGLERLYLQLVGDAS
jgi:ABC-2 type transport system ATP-binding protein